MTPSPTSTGVHEQRPDVHPDALVSTESRDAVKLAMGLVSTMTALLLGLLVGSAKGTYDTQRTEIIQMAAQVAYLDRVPHRLWPRGRRGARPVSRCGDRPGPRLVARDPVIEGPAGSPGVGRRPSLLRRPGSFPTRRYPAQPEGPGDDAGPWPGAASRDAGGTGGALHSQATPGRGGLVARRHLPHLELDQPLGGMMQHSQRAGDERLESFHELSAAEPPSPSFVLSACTPLVGCRNRIYAHATFRNDSGSTAVEPGPRGRAPMKRTVAVAAVALLAILAAVLVVKRTPSLHTEEAVRIAVDAYIYGYPLVTFDMARRQQTNVAVAGRRARADGPDDQDAQLPGGGQPLLRGPERGHALHDGLARRRRASPGSSASRRWGTATTSCRCWTASRRSSTSRARTPPAGAPGVRDHRPGLVGHPAGGRDPGEVAHRHGVGPRTHLLHRHAGGLRGGARPAGPVHGRPAERLRQALHAAAGRGRPRVRHEDGRAQAGQRPRGRTPTSSYLAKLLEDEPAEGGGRRDRRAHGPDRDRPGAGLRRQQARLARPGGLKAVPKLALAKMAAAPEGAEDDERVAVLHLGRRQLRHRLPAARAWPTSSAPAGTARRTPSTRCRRRTRTGDEYDGAKHDT